MSRAINNESFFLWNGGGMRVERVRYLMASVREGSLRAGAARLGISQPTLGSQLVALEEDLNVVLLTRGRHGVALTDAGRRLMPALQQMVAAEDELRLAAHRLSGVYEGVVSMGTTPALAATMAAPVVAELGRRHPGLRFRVFEGTTVEVERRVADGHLELGAVSWARESPEAPRDVVRTDVTQLSLGVLIEVDHPLVRRDEVAWADLEDVPLVTMRRGTTLWDVLHARLARPNVVVEAASMRTVLVMSGRGAGVGFGTRPTSPELDGAGCVWRPLRDRERVTLSVVHRRDTQLSRTAQIVRDLVLERARDLDGDR